jgi:nucleoside-diphosphate-sugar epimerase
MKAIVTGGAGFIGSHIAEALLKQGAKVTVIDDLSAGKTQNIPEGCHFVRADITAPQLYKDFLGGCNVVFHNAASKKNVCLKNPSRDLAVNGAGTLALLEHAKRNNVWKFIHASTGSVYGEVHGQITEKTLCQPVSYYGVSKLAGESYARMYAKDIETVILRYFHVWGSRQEDDQELGGVVSIFTKHIKEGKGITIHGDGTQKRVFTHVEDVVKANMAALNAPSGEVFNVCAKEQVSVDQMSLMLMERYNRIVPVTHTEPLEGDIYRFDVDNSKAEKEFNMKFKGFSGCLK